MIIRRRKKNHSYPRIEVDIDKNFANRLQQFPALASLDPRLAKFLYLLGFQDGDSHSRYEHFVSTDLTIEEYFGLK